jgi:hypothetical protein
LGADLAFLRGFGEFHFRRAVRRLRLDPEVFWAAFRAWGPMPWKKQVLDNVASIFARMRSVPSRRSPRWSIRRSHRHSPSNRLDCVLGLATAQVVLNEAQIVALVGGVEACGTFRQRFHPCRSGLNSPGSANTEVLTGMAVWCAR